MNDRVILHLDIDSFYFSVETAYNGLHFENVPVIICNNKDNGIVLTCNYKARKFNIHSGMPLFKAKRIVKNITIIEPHFMLYKKYSELFFKIIKKYTRNIEIMSLEECYIDVSNIWHKYGNVENLIKNIRQNIKRNLGINLSVGASYTKFLAKTATNLAKPNNYKILNRNNYYDEIKNIHVNDIHGVGKSTSSLLSDIGIKIVDDFINYNNKNYLSKILLSKYSFLLKCLLGKTSATVNLHALTTKSMSLSNTLRFPMIARNELIYAFRRICEQLYFRLLDEAKLTKTVVVKIKYKNSLNNWKSIQGSLDKYTNRYEIIISKILYIINTSLKSSEIIGFGIEFGNLIYQYDSDNDDNVDLEVKKFNDKIMNILKIIHKDNKNITISTVNNLNNIK